VAACNVTGSSGVVSLDATTCALLKVRARFNPALDRDGKPIPAQYRNRFRWELPPLAALPMASWTAIVRFTIGTGGDVTSCNQQAFGPVPDGAKQGCGWLTAATREELQAMRGSSAKPVTVLLRTDYLVSGGVPVTVPVTPAAFKQIWGMTLRREIGPDGVPQACYVDWGQGETALPAARCASLGRFAPGAGPRSFNTVNAALTDGDPNVAAAFRALTEHLPK
jgi:hypothetical protein